MAGEQDDGLSPELAVETLLLAGRLPEETHCVLCGAWTQNKAYYMAECETAFVKPTGPSGLTYFFALLVFGAIGGLLSRAQNREYKEHGKDHIFNLPLRICETCQPGLRNTRDVKAALGRVELYQRLLEKFPKATVTPMKS